MSNEKLPWYNEYAVFGIPETLAPYPDKPVGETLDVAAEQFQSTGLIQLNTLMTYPEVKDHADRLANALHRMGLEKGDRVATILPTSIQFVIADYGISKAGLVHIPSSSLEPVSSLEHKFNTGTPRALICLDTWHDSARQVMAKTGIRHLILTRLRDYSADPPPVGEAPAVDGALWMADLIAAHLPTPPDIAVDVEADIETLLFTGGTTGLPKGCMLTHRNIYANIIQNSNIAGRGLNLLKGAVSVLVGTPFFHSYGHIVMHTMTLNGFNQILIPDARDTATMVEMIKTHSPVLQIGVPTQFMKLAREELKNIGMLGLSGSAPLPPSIQKAFEQRSGGGIMEGYGLSEMSPVTHLNPSFLLRISGGRLPTRINNTLLGMPGVATALNRLLRRIGSRRLGKAISRALALLVDLSARQSGRAAMEKRGTTGIPCPDTDVRLLDVNTGEPLTIADILAGKQGEMCLNGPQRMLGYWPEPGSGVDEDGFIHTSDVVKVDANGYFTIVDRTKDMIIVSGYKVYSREVDDILHEHPATELAATVGVPDPDREGSERVVVYIQPKPEYLGKLTEGEIIDYLRERVARYAVPRRVRIIDEMPLTEVQKLNKKAIREMAMQAVEVMCE